MKPRMVIVTGYDLYQAKQQSTQVGIDAFMLKPVRVQELADVLRKVFQDRRAAREASEGDPEQLDFSGLRLLLVDDVAMNQDLARLILSRKGFDIAVAANGQEAVDAVRAEPFDLVMMDMQMPVMDGCQATEVIRQFNRKLPIIAMTANAMTGDKNKCLASGMNDYVTKPINPRWVKPTGRTVPTAAPAPAPTQPTPETSVLPPSVPGIDLTAGVARCQGDVALYLKLLNDLRQHYGDGEQRLRQLLERRDFAQLRSFGHALKGVAGNLSARQLAEHSAHLEQAEALSEQELSELVATFNRELASVLASIEQLLQAHGTQAPEVDEGHPPFTPDQAAQQLDTLRALVRAQKLEAFDLAQECARQWPDAKHQELWQSVVKALDGFEFGEAEELLKNLTSA
jgi:CheY-like chemotaxis protein